MEWLPEFYRGSRAWPRCISSRFTRDNVDSEGTGVFEQSIAARSC